jgi:hypothetical protein
MAWSMSSSATPWRRLTDGSPHPITVVRNDLLGGASSPVGDERDDHVGGVTSKFWRRRP